MTVEIIDARGLRCPWPVLRLAKAIRGSKSPVIIVADDPVAAPEIGSFARERGLDCVSVQTEIGAGFLVG